MNYSEVKELLNAGFTADEIRTMINPQNSQNNPQQENTNVSEQNTENNSEKTDNPAADQAGAPVDPERKEQENTNNDEKFNQLNQTMEKLIKTIQSSNLNNNSFDKMKETDINTKVDQIMASIIRPEREKGGSEK